MGRGKEWNVDLISKFFLSTGESLLFIGRCFCNVLLIVLIEMSML